ncbi:alpha/beta hydrolase [Pyxidicoccus xibeiensis]|uniref:hypothetical protein n=1 Tax=Pyxidicoccus xibeiensis TaxID=2906759 RepID=UPI0020A771EA|nr:hypothetical protein [Pyxidicoccus xibeiensis]MCP3144937.1 hypothetical protein [Pyxidicoccus xibeiensis]
MHPPFSSRLHGAWRHPLQRLGAALALALCLGAGAGCDDDTRTPRPTAPPEADNAALDVLPGVLPNAVDLSRLVTLEASDPAARFTGRLDLDRVGAFGHSFGGSAAAEACRTDARVKAGLNMDGTFHGRLETEVHVPFLELALSFLRFYVPAATASTYGLSTLEGQRALTLVNTYVRAFFDTHLRARSTPLLEGNSAAFPEVELVVHTP